MVAGLTHRRAIVVGAGQSGLAVAAALIAHGLRAQHDFVVIDEASVGHRRWASRWHSMELLSDARHSALPIRQFPGDQRRHPRADEMNEYLAKVESDLGVEVVWGVRADAVQQRGDGSTLLLSTSAGDVQTRNVVCATGAAAHPRLPDWARGLTAPGVVIHSSEYLYPRQIPTPEVLIVGGGNSGVQLARELSAFHRVTLSIRTPRSHAALARYPSAAGGRRSMWSRTLHREPAFGDRYQDLQRAGVTLSPAVATADGGTLRLADGAEMSPGSVILATGYRPAVQWLPDTARAAPRRSTITGVPGLFVAGMPEYGGRGADTLVRVWRDAAAIARQITDRP
ncbi:NAD(P)/FAD-dependent oxidoreductase [Microbacterium awajiense]